MKFFFALLGVALAVQSSWPQDRLLNWKTQTEYRFRYEASLASGVAIPNSLSAITRHRSDVTLQVLDDKIALFQLKNVQFANDNAELPETSQFVPMERITPQELTEEHQKHIEMPVRFRFEQGMASELQFHPDDSIWSKNVKRSIISMLQLNWEQISSDRLDRDEREFSNGNKFDLFMEKNVEGNCEVAYNLVSEKKERTTVIKSINFDNCEERLELTYNYRFTAECPECDYKKIAPQTVYKFEIEKDQLKEIELNSVYSVALKDQTLIRTKVQARLTLEKTASIDREIHTSKGPKESIVYNKEFDYAVEEYLKNGEEAKFNPMEAIPKKFEIIEEIVDKLAHQKDESSIESADYFMRLVQYIRTCSEQELKKIHDKIYKSQDKKTQSLIEHSLAVAGSKNTIQHLLRHFHHLSTPRLVQMLKSIQETPFPSEQIAQLLHEFIQTERCSGSPVLQQAGWLAYGAVVRGAIGKTAETHAIPASQEFKSHAARIMKVLFERADTIYEKVLALKTVANSGLDHNIALLQKVISDKKQPTIVRMEAIDALRHLSEQIPRRIQQLLMPVYSNRLEKNEIRMAALRQLVQAKPALPELSQIVLRMEREPNQHVAAYTYHLLSSLMESPLPAHRNISILASNLLRTSLYRPEFRILSIVKHWSVYSQDSLSGLSLQLGSLLGKDSVIPKDMMVALETLFGGNWNKQLAQIGFSQQNVEALFNKLISRLSRWEKKESISRASRVSIKKSVTVLKDLAQQLNIRVRQSTTEEPFAMLYFRYKQMDYALLPLDEQYLDQLIENYVRDGSFDLKKLERLFNTDSDFEFATAGFVMDSMMKISNSLGLPMVFYNKMPTVFGINGKISMEKVPYGLRVRVQAQPRLSALYFHSMHIWVPSFTNGFKNLRTAEINLPIDMELEITYKKELEIKLKTQMPKEEEKSLIRLHSRPVCFTRYFKSTKDIFYGYKETTVPMPTIDRMSQDMTKKYEIQGLEFVLSGSNYRLWNLETALLGEHHLDLTVIPSRRIPKELSMKFVIGEVETGTIRGPKIEKMLRKEMETEEGEWESRSESSRIEHLNKIVRDMKLDRAYTHIVKVEVRGHETSEMLIRTECEGNMKFCRLVAELKPEGGRRQWTVKSELEVVLPRPVETIQQLKDQKHREVQVLLETKWGSEDKNTIEILAQLEQSKTQRDMVQRHPELRGLPAHEQLVRLARLNQLKAKINYQLTRENQKVFEQIFDVVKGYAYWSSNVEMADNQEGQVTVKMTSEPLVPGLFNLTVETPETFFRAQQVRVPVVILPSIVRQPKNMIRHTSFEKSECRIQGDRVNSFDDVIFRAPMSNCYTVVAKDCSSAEPRYAVLVKNAKRNGQEKMVKIIYEDNEMELEIVDEKLKVNGKSLRNSELEESRIEKIGEHYVIDLDEVVVRFDGSDIKVLLSNEQMETQCGLCGHFDGEKRNDYRTAGNDETEDLEVFHRSYIVKSDECSIESPKGQKAYRQYNDYTSEEDNDSSEWSDKKSKKVSQKKDSRSEEYDDTEEPESKTAMEEHGHRICFSLEPVPSCPKNMSPQKTTHKKVEFGCLPRHDTRARKWASAIRQGKSVDIDIKKNFSENLSVPTICVA